MLRGIAASSGIGIGAAFILPCLDVTVDRRPAADPAAELSRFERAVDIFCGRISALAEQVARRYGESESGILTTQIMIINDERLRGEIERRLAEERENAQCALSAVLDDYTSQFLGLEDELLKARAADFRDIKAHMLQILRGEAFDPLPDLPDDCVVVADELCPSSAALLSERQVSAIVGAGGTTYSHAAIIARAAKIPAVVSAGGSFLSVIRSGDELIVDGSAGEVILRPTPEEKSRYRQRRHHQSLIRSRMESTPAKASTRDGFRLELGASVVCHRELPQLSAKGAEGAFVFHGQFAGGETDEHRLFLSCRSLVRALKGNPVTIAPGGDLASGPAPGDIPQAVLSAFLRASSHGNVRIAAPGVTSLKELRKARCAIEELKASFMRRRVDFDPDIRLGAVMGAREAAPIAGELALEADFFVLCADSFERGCDMMEKSHPESVLSSFAPEFLRLLFSAVQAAREACVPVYVTGTLAADPMMLPFLAGCGVSGLFAPLRSLSGLREQIANICHEFWRERVAEIIALPSLGDVVAYIKKNWSERA
ncbi:MAG: hypothetical protein LBU86_05760 [Oscillospiraceae bacterium]|nr:hypothetical protein [Oscillospiraceae bacterium]